MAGLSPAWKVRHAGKLRASLDTPEHAALICGLIGAGATIAFKNGRILWREGYETASAKETPNMVADIVRGRMGLE